MKRSTYIWSIIALTILRLPAAHDAGRETSAMAKPQAVKAYGHLPLSFEANQGQTDHRIKFLSHGSGYSLFLTGDEAVLALKKPGGSVARDRQPKSAVPSAEPPAVVRMKLVGANATAKLTGLAELPGKSNYFIGNDPKKWRTNVPNYAKVKYTSVYPGVDLVYYGNQRQLEYDFVVQPGADPRQIALQLVAPASSRDAAKMAALRIDKNGDLVVGTEGGEVIFHKPVVYQPATDNAQWTKQEKQSTNDKRFVSGNYILKDDRVTFEIASYDKTKPLVIDPTLAYSTYLGGSGLDQGNGIAVDKSGNAYITGLASSFDFPVTPGAFQSTFGGGGQGGCSTCGDAFVSKINAAGSALVYSTYLGGSGNDAGFGIAVDAAGNAYVTGSTASSNFPTTLGAFETTFGGGTFTGDAFVSKLDATGSALVYSTYLGGSADDAGSGIVLDASGKAYVAGFTLSSDFPTTPGAFQTALAGIDGNAFVSKLNAVGSALVYSTYLGGGADSASAIALDSTGDVYLTGHTNSTAFPTTPGAFQTTLAGQTDAFVSKLNAAASALVFSTLLGGAGGSGLTTGDAIAVDSSNNTYVTGNTDATDFPTTRGAFQTTFDSSLDFAGFVSKVNAAGSALVYSTFLTGFGLADATTGVGIAVDTSGNAYVTGVTDTVDFPTTADAFQTSCGNPNTFPGSYAFFSRFNGTGSALLFSTALGGVPFEGCDNHLTSGHAIALDASGNAYIAGVTSASAFPVSPGAFQRVLGSGSGNAFVVKISPTDAAGIALAPGALTFSPQNLGTTSAPQTVTLFDAGTQPLNITNVVASGDFAEANGCDGAVQPRIPCTLSVTFIPTAGGVRTGAVTITDSAMGSPHKLLLTGTGISVTLTPSSLTFGAQLINTASGPKTVTLTNTGAATVDISSIGISGPSSSFSETNNCGSSLLAGASCNIAVTFRPTKTSTCAETGTLTVTESSGGVQTAKLSGVGTVMTLSVNSLNFGNQPAGTTSSAKTIILTNHATSRGVTIAAITISGLNSPAFAETNTCGTSVAPGASCTLSVTFTPHGKGSKTATLNVWNNGGAAALKVSLTGNGT